MVISFGKLRIWRRGLVKMIISFGKVCVLRPGGLAVGTAGPTDLEAGFGHRPARNGHFLWKSMYFDK